MLDTFFFVKEEFRPSVWYQVWEELGSLKGYLYKVCKHDAKNARVRVFEHAIAHYKPEKGNLNAYLRKLIDTSVKRNPKFTPVDTTIIDATVEEGAQRFNEYTGLSSRQLEVQVEEAIISNTEKLEKVASLALSNMRYFLLYARQVISRDLTTYYFPDTFKKETYRCFSFCKEDFHPLVLHIYNSHKSGFETFLTECSVGDAYRELDMDTIEKRTSKRLVLKDKNGGTLFDPDVTQWYIKNLGDKRIIKVYYKEIYESLCDLVDAEGCNAIKYTIGETYIFKTLGGSLSLINVPLFRMYDIIRYELITNMLYDFNARLLSVGSECVYLLQSPTCTGEYIAPKTRVIRGFELSFEYRDVTPEATT